MSQHDREGLESQYDISLVSDQIAQLQRDQAVAEAAAAAAAAALAIDGHDHQQSMGDNGNGDQYMDTQIQVEHDDQQHHLEPPKKRKRKIFQTEDGIKKCSRCRVKRVDEPTEILEKYATCLNCRTKRKIDSRKHHEETEYQLPSAESTADALTALMNASRNDDIKKYENNEDNIQKKKLKRETKITDESSFFRDGQKRAKLKDYANLPNLYNNYDDFVERIRLNCEHDLFDHHFRGYVDESLIPRYKLDEVQSETFQYISRKVINLYIQPLMNVTGYRFPVRDYHKGGSKSKKVTFMFICSQDKTKQRKSRSTDQRKIANRLKVNECDSKINLNYDLCTGFLQINFNHKAHHPYMWKAESIQLHKNSSQYMEDVDQVDYRHQEHDNNEHNQDLEDHGHHDRDAETDNMDLNLIDSIPASSMQYLTGVEDNIAAVVNLQREREQERQAELDRQAVEDAANQFLQAQARELKEERENEAELERNELDHVGELDDDEKEHINVDNIDQELLNMR